MSWTITGDSNTRHLPPGTAIQVGPGGIFPMRYASDLFFSAAPLENLQVGYAIEPGLVGAMYSRQIRPRKGVGHVIQEYAGTIERFRPAPTAHAAAGFLAGVTLKSPRP